MPDKNFVPNGDKIPKGASPVSLVGASAPLMGQSIPGRSAPGSQGGGTAQAAPQRTAQLSPAQTPRGAQEVPLAGAARLGQAAAPQQRPVALGQEANDVHTIRVEGLGADGRRYKADFDAVFPKGTKITGIGEI